MSSKLYLLVTVDTNDADYVSNYAEVTLDKLEILKPLFKAIKKFKPYKTTTKPNLNWTHRHNFPFGEVLRDDLGEKSVEELYSKFPEALELFLDEYLPTDFQGCCHTITEIKLVTITEDIWSNL